jgi:hemerythrin-like domain-containing protein
MTTTPRLTLTARSTGDPEPGLTSMVVTHRAMRQDLARLTALLGRLAGDADPQPRRTQAVCRYTAALLAQIRIHHDNEDHIVWPLIAATARQSVDLTPLTDDREAIEAAADRARQALASFGAHPGTLAELHVSVSELRDMLDEHIADEEQQLLPAMRRYLSAEAYRWCERQAGRTASLPARRFTAPWLARYAQPGELRPLLATGGWPLRILLAATRPGYARLERRAFGTGWPPLRPHIQPIARPDRNEEEEK